MCSLGEWVDFFVKAGIPSGEAASYALIFSRNRIQKNMLIDLNKEYLRDMGITPLGDIIAILKHAKTVHETVSRAFIMSEASEEPAATSSTVNRLMDHFSLKLKEAKEEITSKKEKPQLRNVSSGRGVESQAQALKSSVKLGASSISLSDTDDGSEESEAKSSPPEVNRKPDLVMWKPEASTSRERVKTEAASSSAAQKLCVFSRLGNAGAKAANDPENIAIIKETARVPPSGKVAKVSQPERSERSSASSVKTMASSELKLIKITTEFSDDDDVEINIPEQAIAKKVAIVNTKATEGRRKRLHSSETQELDKGTSTPPAPAVKKVRFGGTSTRVIPSDPVKSPVFLGHTVVVKTPTSAVERFEVRKMATIRSRERNDPKVNINVERPRPDTVQTTLIKSRIGIVRPTPAKPISKMVSDSIMATKGDLPKKSVKSRINLKIKGGKEGKLSVLERLG